LSLILDALNRSRQDSDPVPGLATRHDADVSRAVPPWRRYFPWSALTVAVLVIVLLLLEREWASPEPVATLAPAPRAGIEADRAPPAAPVPAVMSDTVEAEVDVEAAPPAVEVAPEVEAEPAITDVAEPPVDPAIARLYEQPDGGDSPVAGKSDARAADQATATRAGGVEKAPLPPAQEEQRIDIEQLVLQAQEEIENARLAEHSAPFISELSQQTKDAIPTVYYQRHDYAGDNGESQVVLNGDTLGEGGSPAAGMRVVEILPDSVVLNYRGTEFRLRALNSWINL
jgi:hypothetical protein